MDYDALVRAYRKMRDAEATIQREADAKIATIKEARSKLEAVMLQALNDSKGEGIRTASGTFFRTIDVIPSGADWGAFYDWIKDNDAFDALERRIKRTFIADYMKANDDAVPPGVNVIRKYKIGVRKNTGDTASIEE